MKRALIASIKWRLVALGITETYFLITLRHIGDATINALVLQFILFISQTLWFWLVDKY